MKPQIVEMKTHPAGAAKKGDPITRIKVIATRVNLICLDISNFAAALGPVAKDGKNNHHQHRDKYDDNQNFNGAEQKATERKH